jgi:PAS domain S-box-containing protein
MTDGPIRVLLIDDDEDYFVITRDLLGDIASRPHELEWKTGFDEGLESVLRNGHDVCLVDYRLGERNGLDLIRLAVADGCKSPLILMTGQGDHEIDVEAMRAGAADYLIKGSVDTPLLERALRYAIERAQVLQSLRATEERFRRAFDSAAIGMALVATDGRLLQVNRALCEMLGYTEKELLALSVYAVIHPDDQAAAMAIGRQLLSAALPASQSESRYRHKSGAIVWAQSTSTLVRDAAGLPLHFITQIQDTTRRKQAEDALRQSEEQLRQVQKMEAVGRLAGGIAHDFNNLITVITGYSTLLSQKLGEAHPLQHNVDEIQKSAERAAGLTRQLLAFSRKQVRNPRLLDLNTVLSGIDGMLRRIIGEDVEMRITADPQLGQIRADPGQIEQVIMNMVINARDAMPTGGKLAIETARIVLDGEYIGAHPAIAEGVYARLAFTDTGVGMSDQVKTHLFEPFFTTKGLGKGTGLGLATCYGIVRHSGGHIHAYSEVGQGTTFKIYLPIVAEAAPVVPAHRETAAVQSGSECILLAEDEEALRELAGCVLRDAGYTVLEAANGLDALHIAEENHTTPIQLLITDVIMPHMGGKDLAEQLRTVRPDTKVLYMSGYTDDALTHHGVLESGVALLEKPFTPTRLAYKVREVLDAATV